MLTSLILTENMSTHYHNIFHNAQNILLIMQHLIFKIRKILIDAG